MIGKEGRVGETSEVGEVCKVCEVSKALPIASITTSKGTITHQSYIIHSYSPISLLECLVTLMKMHNL